MFFIIWSLRLIAKIHNSQDKVNRMEQVTCLVKGTKTPHWSGDFSSHCRWLLSATRPESLGTSVGLLDSELTLSI